MADPTMQFLADLDDPSKWHVVKNVPVTRPHKREVQGKKPIVVTEKDLPGIARTVNAAYQSAGVPIRVTIGHIKQDPDEDEVNQPQLTGYAKNATVGTFGPGKVPGVLVDLYLRKETARQVLSQHPFRSMEFDPVERRIHGIALLTRDPALDLGVVTYRSNQWIVNYDDMKDDDEEGKKSKTEQTKPPGEKSANPMPGEDDGIPTDPDAPGEDANDDGVPDNEQFGEDQSTEDPMGEDAAYKGFCTMMQRYIASGGLSAMGPMGGLMPQAQMVPAAGEASAQYQRGKAVSKEIDTEVAALKAEVAAMKKERDREAAKRLLDPLKEAIKFNYAKEEGVLVSLPTDKERVEHVQYMRENYAPLLTAQIGGRMLDTYQAGPLPVPSGEPTGVRDKPPHFDEILSVMRAKPGLQYEHAEAKVMEKYQKTTA